MRWSLLLAVVLGVSGCSSTPPPEASSKPTAETNTSQSTTVDTSFDSAPVASEWLIDTKKTLRGLSAEQDVQFLSDLYKAGVVDIRVSDIVADPQDASFMIANTLLIELPASEGRRKSALDTMERLGVPTSAVSGDILTLDLTTFQLQVPASN